MALYTTDFLIRPEDGWVLVATNPGELIIKPAVYHPWWVAITDSGTPAATVVGVPMGRDPSNRNENYHLVDGVTGLVYIKIATPTDSSSFEKMAFNVTTGSSAGGGSGGGVSASFETVGPPYGPDTDGSGTITVGGTSQDVFAALVTRRGWAVQNQSVGDLYVRQSTASPATVDQNSVRISPGLEYVADVVNGEKVKIIGATTGQAFWARSW